MKDLNVIEFSNTNILGQNNSAKKLSSIITDLKNLEELRITRGALQNQLQAKTIADGLMRAKQLKMLDISENPSITAKGISSIAYNLAFSPKMIYLNISNST